LRKTIISHTLLVFIFSFQSIFSQTFPDEDWERNPYVEFSGWDTAKLNALRAYVVDSTATTGMMLIHDGKVILEYGNLTENSYIASCRKSILAMLYGKYVEDGTIDLDMSLNELDVDEIELLLKNEKETTIKDIISSRSGVFLPASNPGDLQNLAPERGSVEPGEFWLYSNWDFNMVGHIFEKETKSNIYNEIESQLALPLGMQDWDRALQQKDGDITVSNIMAYHMWFSTRDMARMGLLMLNKGKWKNAQLISKEWVKEITAPKTSFAEINNIAPFFKENGAWFSYGYMWWLWEKPNNDMLEGAYTASGAIGQNITVFPKMNTVLVIKTNDVFERQKGDHNYIIDELSKSYNPESAIKLLGLVEHLQNDDITQFVKKFDTFKQVNTTVDYKTVLNQLGYYYLGLEEFDNAIEIFKFNIEQHPDLWNLYDSLGEGYFLAGEYQNALKSYGQALDLNTKNQYNYNVRHAHTIKRIELKLQ